MNGRNYELVTNWGNFSPELPMIGWPYAPMQYDSSVESNNAITGEI